MNNANSKSFKVPQKLLNLPRKRTFVKVLRDIANNPRLRFLPLLIYPYFGPFVSSLTMTITRILFGFVKDEIDKRNLEALYSVDIFLYLALIPIFACTSYLIINKALKHYETIYVIPLFKVGTLMHSLLSGTIFLQELADASFEDLIFFILGATEPLKHPHLVFSDFAESGFLF